MVKTFNIVLKNYDMFVVKECSKCKEYKLLSEFSKDIRYSFGVKSNCKICASKYYEYNKVKKLEYAKKYYKYNKEKIREGQKKYYEANNEKLREYQREYFEANKEKILEYNKKYQEANKEKAKEYNKKYYKSNKEYAKKYSKKYNEANRNKIRERKKKYREANKEKVRQYHREYIKERRNKDVMFRLQFDIIGLIRVSIRRNGYTKRSRTHEILGCDFETFKLHIEKQFTKGMTWDNRSDWHIDHIYPVSLAKDEEELIRLNHYTNLRPMWAIENISKGNKIETHQTKLPI